MNLYQGCQVWHNLCAYNILCKLLVVTAHAEVAERVLDKCCKVDDFNSRMHESFWVDFKFEFIEDLQDFTPTGGLGC